MTVLPNQFGEIQCSRCEYQVVEVVSKEAHEVRVNKDAPLVDEVDLEENKALICCPECGHELRVQLPDE